MAQFTRRRFLTISAGAGASTALSAFPLGAAGAAPMYQWRGVAMGAGASITLAHPRAERIVAQARAEIARLEGVFSLYQADSALSRLNAQGRLAAPPFELLECLGLCNAVHAATDGLFDASVQPLWALHAEHFARGAAPDDRAIADTRARVGWSGVSYDAAEIRFRRKGMALTLNGVAQGYIADRVADLLSTHGLTDILVDTGEFRALGGHPEGGVWPIALDTGTQVIDDAVALRDRALSSSGPRGTVFDAAGQAGHILDPRTGRPSRAPWQLVSVTARRAGLADALSTAMCLMSRSEIDRTLAAFPDARLVHLT